jgi:hypothetical protein
MNSAINLQYNNEIFNKSLMKVDKMKLNSSFYGDFLKSVCLDGWDSSDNYFKAINTEAEFPASKVVELPVFEKVKDGVRINYVQLSGEIYTQYTDAKNPKPIAYHQIRLSNPDGRAKYKNPYGFPAMPFFSPRIINKFKEKESIETLFITEGAKKSFCASQQGLDVVGLSSINTYKDKETRRLHSDIEQLIAECGVKNIVILFDADCWDISEEGLIESTPKNLENRPQHFFNCVANIRALVNDIPLLDERNLNVFFYAVESHLLGNPKGLDDLLIAATKNNYLEALTDDILNLSSRKSKSDFFFKRKITKTVNSLKKDFGLLNVYDFYNRHKEKIGEQKFLYKGHFYKWDEDSSELESIAPEWASKVFLIDDSFYEEVLVPYNSKGINGVSIVKEKPELKSRKIATLKTKYGNNFKKYLKEDVNYFNSFCSIPNHFTYHRRIKGSYNKYHPIPYQDKEGDFETILAFIKHIFGNREIERNGVRYKEWELGLDYLSLLLNKPMMPLPVLCLYSAENQTGKSTFKFLLERMFGDNVLDMKNNDFRTNFNSHFAGKLLAICEETLLDRKEDAEILKSWSTKEKIAIEAKGKDPYQIEFFCKFQLYSNNKKMIYATKHDTRYWMLQVPRPKKLDSNLIYKMEEEIPAFLYFLKTRSLTTKHESRMHFHHSLYLTPLFYEVVASNELADVKHLRSQIEEVFLVLNQKDSNGNFLTAIPEKYEKHREEFTMPLNVIKRLYFHRKPMQDGWLKEVLNELGVRKLEGANISCSWPYIVDHISTNSFNESGVQFDKKKGRPYLFKRDIFLKDV